MQVRATPLPAPPERPPYFAVTVGEQRYILRAPSLHRIGRMVQSVDEQHQRRLTGLVSLLGQGRSILAVAASAPDVLELFAAFVGVAWADPVHELETEPWVSGALGPYGAAVYEELHEAGWALSQIVLAGLAIARQVQAESALDAEVTAQAAFFLRPKAPSSSSASTSSAGSSEPTPGDLSES
jgi:hypothetical protein